jgi:ferredoxin
MRVIVDPEACMGHGQCHAVAPELFVLDELGYCVIGEVEVPVHLEAAALKGESACPERAIVVITEENL